MLQQRIEEVNKANHAFYAAFGNLDIGEMDKIWAHQEYVTCIHPGWTLRSGWPPVRDSWVLIFNNTFFHDVRAHRRDGAGGRRYGLGRLRGEHHHPSS